MAVLESALCQSMNTNAQILILLLEGKAKIIRDMVNAVIDFISDLDWSAKDAVEQAAKDLIDGKTSYCPELSEVDAIVNMINKCNYLNNSIFASPSAFYTSAIQELNKGLNDAITALTSGLPEFSASKMIKEIMNFQNKMNFSKLIDDFKKLLGCLQSLCGLDIEPYLRRLNYIITSCRLDNNGNLDPDKIWAATGIDDAEKYASLFTALDSVIAAWDSLITSMDNIAKLLSSTHWFDPLDPWAPKLTL